MKKKYWIKDLSENQVIHAPTEEIAKKLCNRFDELGLTWYSGTSYLERNYWEEYYDQTCYSPAIGTYSSKRCAKEKDCEVLTINQLYDFEEPLKIEVGKFYRTRDGKKVRIYSIENWGTHPIYGILYDDTWASSSYRWKKDGSFNAREGSSEYDIIGEWKDELEFDVFKYIAMDKDGKWYLYSKKPCKEQYTFQPQNKEEDYYIRVLPKHHPKNFIGSWEDSLHEIVDGKLIKVK